MTDYEKKRIAELRENGLSYNAIGIELGLLTGTVKMYCTRHGLGGKRAPEVSGVVDHYTCCEQCGKPVEQLEHRKRKKFCSKECRMKWWSEHPEERKPRTSHAFTCRNCGTVFSVYGETHRDFCSRKCFADYRRSDRER